MELKDFNIVTECGIKNRAIIRYGNICHIGCFSGTKEEAMEAISKKYTGIEKDEYIAKIEELFDTDISSYKERNVELTTDYNQVLFWACEENHLNVIKYLVSQNIDIKVTEDYAFRWACENGNIEIVKYLASQGANIEAVDNTPICWASENGHLEVVKYLVSQGANIRAKNNTPIRQAYKKNHIDVVKYLISQGAILE